MFVYIMTCSYAVAVTWLLLTFNLNTFNVQRPIYHNKYQQNTLELIGIRIKRSMKSSWFFSFSSANLLALIYPCLQFASTTTRLSFNCRSCVVYIQLSTIKNINQLFLGGKICISSFYSLYKLLFYVGLIADSGLTVRMD
jgi:hypothetical protein